MTKKELLMEVFNEAIMYRLDYVAVSMETITHKVDEIVVYSNINFERKKEHYKNDYDDNLILNAFGGIRIVSACNFDRGTEFLDVVAMLNNTFKVEEEKKDGNNN